MAKRKTSPSSFEESLAELETLVEAMENDQLPLEELVAHYEKGAGLLQHCEKVLSEARKRIELIEVAPAAENGLEPDPSSDDDEGRPGDSDPGDDAQDDIRLL